MRSDDNMAAFKGDDDKCENRCGTSGPHEISTGDKTAQEVSGRAKRMDKKWAKNVSWNRKDCYHDICHSQVKEKKIEGRTTKSEPLSLKNYHTNQ